MRFTPIALLLAGLILGTGSAQAPSWASLQIPGGVQTPALGQQGKIVWYQDGSRVQVFSAFTRTWHTYQTAGSAALRQANDWLLIQEGAKFTAIGSMRGTFETIQTTAGVVLNPTGQRNDSLLLVLDGDQLWAFSGLVGTWTAATVSPQALIAVQRHAAVIADGVVLAGLSAFTNRWVLQGVTAPASQVTADGTIGTAVIGSTVWAFSAQRETWSAANVPAGARTMGNADVALWADGTQCWGFSGPCGAFASVAAPGAWTLTADEHVGVATLGNQALLFSAATAGWTTFTTATPAVLAISAATATLQEADVVHAYSALLGTIASLPIVAVAAETNWSVVAATELGNNEVHLFSAFTGRWHAAPAGSPSAVALTCGNAALVATNTGVAAFSARSGAFVPLVTAAGARTHVDRNSSLLAVEDGAKLHVFEPRRGVWLTTTLSGSAPLTVSIWRTALLAIEGNRVYGYGSQLGEIEVFDLPEAPVTYRVNSESSGIATTNFVVAHSAVPDLVSLWQFPEFRRLYVRGSLLQLHLHGVPGAGAAVMISRAAAASITLPWGTLLLEPGQAALLATGMVGADGRAVFAVPVPDDPALAGIELAFQGGTQAPFQWPYLTRMGSVTIP